MGNCWSAKNANESPSQTIYPYQQNINRNESPKFISNILYSNNKSSSASSSNYKKVDVLDTMGNTVKPIVERAEKTGTCNLAGKKLEHIPEKVFTIGVRLRTLDLSTNSLPRIPPAISAFEMLKHLNISSNKLVTLPSEIKHLIKLEVLNIAHNRISSLPASMRGCMSLRDLDVSHNELRLFPDQLAPIKKLDVMNLSHNRILEIPVTIEDFNCTEINLNDNEIESLCREMSRLPRLKVLRLDRNLFDLKNLVQSAILADSGVCLLTVEQCNFLDKDLHREDGYDKYMERYTASKKKIQ